MSGDARSILMNGQETAGPTGIDAIMASKGQSRAAADLPELSGRSTLKGMNRELYDLIGGRAPIVETTATNKAKLGKDTVTKWAFRPFENQGRKDGLRLSHWVKAAEPEASYPFSKFNKPSRVPHYTRDEYVRLLQDDEWTEEETNRLFELCRRFDLRFIVVHDHFIRMFPPGKGNPRRGQVYLNRSVEDLKARYYSVWTTIARAHGVRPNSVDVTYRYDAEHEKKRKKQLAGLMSRNISQIHEESLLISELKRIRRYKQDAKKQAHDSLKRPSDDDRRSHKKKKRGVYSFDEQRAQHKTATPITTHLRSSLMHKPLAVKQKVSTQITNIRSEVGVGESPMPTSAVQKAYDVFMLKISKLAVLQTDIEGKVNNIAQMQDRKVRLESKRQIRPNAKAKKRV